MLRAKAFSVQWLRVPSDRLIPKLNGERIEGNQSAKSVGVRLVVPKGVEQGAQIVRQRKHLAVNGKPCLQQLFRGLLGVKPGDLVGKGFVVRHPSQSTQVTLRGLNERPSAFPVAHRGLLPPAERGRQHD